MMVNARINDRPYRMLVDTGAEVTLLKRPIQNVPLSQASGRVQGVTGDQLALEGEQEVSVEFEGSKVRHKVIVARIAMEADGLLGVDLLKKLGVVLDMGRDKAWIPRAEVIQHVARGKDICVGGNPQGRTEFVQTMVHLIREFVVDGCYVAPNERRQIKTRNSTAKSKRMI